jgi:hypothetical protein
MNKSELLILLFLTAAEVKSQSVMTLGTGTSIGILTGAELDG